ncbi:uncharacterized protein cp110 isoform X1 [Scleropages formosus]|nr:uncharacterized protein LOC108930165 isoform X1 [Scleropages formosus]
MRWMELYEEFVGRLRSRLLGVSRAPIPRDPTARGSSCILFHGSAILPPMLTEQRREEMLRYKEETLRLPRQRKTAECNPRMLRVRMLLDSVQVRRAPSLKEFVQSKDTTFVTQSAHCLGANTEFSSRTDRIDWASVPLRDLPLPVCSTLKPMHDGKVDDITSHTLACAARGSLGAKGLSMSSEVDKRSRTQDSIVCLEAGDTGQEHPERVVSEPTPPSDSVHINALNTERVGPQLGSARSIFWSFPRPQLSCSPTRREKGGGFTRKLFVNTALPVSSDADKVGCPTMGDENFKEKILDRSMQIGQLEMCLSGLKSSISDLGTILVWEDDPTEKQCPKDKQLACARRVLFPGLTLAEGGLVGPDCCMTNASTFTPGDIGYRWAVEDCRPSLNRSYDVEAPSGLWLQAEPDQGADRWGDAGLCIPEPASYVLQSQAKHRLLVGPSAESACRVPGSRAEGKQSCSASKGAPGRKGSQCSPSPAASGLCERHRLTDYTSDVRDFVPQTPCLLASHVRPLVAAAVKGFLTRRLLRTEQVAQLRRVVTDSQDFLLAFQSETPTGGTLVSQQDLILLERVLLQLRSALYEIHDIFFCCTVGERMKMISGDRELARARELKRLEKEERQSHQVPGTAKSLERKRSWTVQKAHEERQQKVKGRDGCRRVCERVCQKSVSILSGRL